MFSEWIEEFERNKLKQQSEADKMFEELGYIKYLDNKDILIYKKQTDFFKVSITFDKRDFKKTFYAEEGYWVANNSDKWVTQEFKNDFDKYCSANGYWSSIWHEFTIQELQAINKNVEELKWTK